MTQQDDNKYKVYTIDVPRTLENVRRNSVTFTSDYRGISGILCKSLLLAKKAAEEAYERTGYRFAAFSSKNRHSWAIYDALQHVILVKDKGGGELQEAIIAIRERSKE